MSSRPPRRDGDSDPPRPSGVDSGHQREPRIERVAVVGAGTMGSQIALQCALGHLQVCLHDVSSEQLRAAVTENRRRLDRQVEKGRLDSDEAERVWASLETSDDLATAVGSAQLVIEAVAEDTRVKRFLFASLDRLAPAEAILASNSSTIVASTLSEVTTRPDRCCNMHFFHPVLVMDLCEVMAGPLTSAQTIAAVVDVLERIGRTPVVLRRESHGFIVNRILHAATQEAYRIYHDGVADYADIDLAVERGLRWPLGPFKLADFSGLDVTLAARRHMHQVTGDPTFKPYPELEDKVRRGELGRKTGRGWYDYSSGEPRLPDDR